MTQFGIIYNDDDDNTCTIIESSDGIRWEPVCVTTHEWATVIRQALAEIEARKYE